MSEAYRSDATAQQSTHRRVKPERDVTFDSLFENYKGGAFDGAAAWPTDEFVGAEQEIWAIKEPANES